MKKLLFIIPIIFGTFCITPAHPECAPDDINCTTTRDNTTSKTCTQNTDCADMFGAKKAICKDYGNEKRCTVRECKNGFYLWFYKGSSMGICYTQKLATNYCNNPRFCKEQNCEPKFEKKQNPEGTTVDAFTGCVKKQSTPLVIPATGGDEHPEQANTGCNLTFTDGTTIKNVDWAESAKPGYASTTKLLNTPVQKTSSIYQNSKTGIIQQNKSQFDPNFNDKTPHLFNLTSVTYNGKPIKFTPNNLDEYNYIEFKCNNGDLEIKPIKYIDDQPGSGEKPNDGITLGLECESGTLCQKFDVFSAIDEQISYLQRLDDHFFTGSSVWKTDAGKFNTARLASDSIAGVVLGTAGGIITSKIVKKNQIKNGFEDLKCTIGGQVVATYGDEFTVSVK